MFITGFPGIAFPLVNTPTIRCFAAATYVDTCARTTRALWRGTGPTEVPEPKVRDFRSFSVRSRYVVYASACARILMEIHQCRSAIDAVSAGQISVNAVLDIA